MKLKGKEESMKNIIRLKTEFKDDSEKQTITKKLGCHIQKQKVSMVGDDISTFLNVL